MDILNWKEMLCPYEQAVAELKLKFEYMKSEYKKLGLYCPIESISGRVKEPSSILGKAKKKGIPLDRIEEDIEDIAGVRIICQFSEDIQKAISLIRRHDGYDFTIVEERDYITNTKPSGYRSYHIIIKYPVSSVMGYKEVLAEIQIRTMAMNFWAVTEHTLNYKYKGHMPEEIKQRLKNCAEAAFNLDNEMSTIRNEIMYAQRVNKRMDNLTSNIIDNIQNMYFNLKLSEMDKINTQFVELWNKGDIDELKKFSDMLDKMAESYRG
ncbi:MAG: GTP pyrophosphokinase family protein [Clostridia bacterium]|jgi:putative GTP pyrophosphokinase|nr:GTP pyrophosphokinase family protein [Clostridia bacterium]MCI1999194.1 GTP pyrophosphokinase family protein [Clostridia bacterium]MCI2014853.1 GTP pyrophosphokinase family protein [Clostridia bacterium]